MRFAAVLVLIASNAHALVLCRMPSGETYAGDVPPPGCVVTQSYRNPDNEEARTTEGSRAESQAKQEAADTAFEAGAIVARRRIEGSINEAADSLVSAGEALAQLERASPDYMTWSQAQIDEYWAMRRIYVSKQSDARGRISELRSEFSRLTDRVRAQHHGSLPPAWRPTLNCQSCPS